MRLFNSYILLAVLFLFVSVHLEGRLVNKKEFVSQNIIVKDVHGLVDILQKIRPGQTVLLADGVYANLELISRVSGVKTAPITIKALHVGKAIISGNSKVELWGNYTILKGLYFRDGARKSNSWQTHGPGLVAIFGNHCRVSECLFFNFDCVDSAYITTSLDKKGRVPKFGRIDHCAFIGKKTLDQVINLNNKLNKDVSGKVPGEAMFHRVDHCYFRNPKKIGNAGGGIRIGYWRADFGECLVDSNYFERQDSEAEVITSKSQYNVFYHNVFKNCRGTLNFRHGDYQVAIGNYFLATDLKYEYGGMFVWGSGHLILNNEFSLFRTLGSRGHACLCFNLGLKGAEHALAFDISCIGNIFDAPSGYAIHLAPLYTRRMKYFNNEVKHPYNIRFIGNKFLVNTQEQYTIVADPFGRVHKQIWVQNQFIGPFTDNLIDSGPVQKENYNSIRAEEAKRRYIIKYLKKHPFFNFLQRDIKYPLNLLDMTLTSLPNVKEIYHQVGPMWAKDRLEYLE